MENIYKELSTDIEGFVHPGHGDLSGWAKQGKAEAAECVGAWQPLLSAGESSKPRADLTRLGEGRGVSHLLVHFPNGPSRAHLKPGACCESPMQLLPQAITGEAGLEVE